MEFSLPSLPWPGACSLQAGEGGERTQQHLHTSPLAAGKTMLGLGEKWVELGHPIP